MASAFLRAVRVGWSRMSSRMASLSFTSKPMVISDSTSPDANATSALVEQLTVYGELEAQRTDP
jgi:hypothetical protein